VKLKPDADPQAFVRRLSHAPGIIKMTQTFPDETDRELARLFVVEIEQSAVESAIDQLRSDSLVEYAADPAPRRLIR